MAVDGEMDALTYDGYIEKMRRIEYPMLKDATYLDHAGTTLYSKSLLEAFSADMMANLYGNPHSASQASQRSTHLVQHVRLQLLRLFDASPDDFDLVFVANATAGIKLIADALREHDLGFWYGYHRDSHTSLVGVRDMAREHRCFDSDADVEEWLARDNDKSSLGLFAYPAQSNMNGRRLPLQWGERVRRQGVLTLLDAAALLSTSPLSLSNLATAPDFTVLSLYKIFGFPDLGALIVRKDAAWALQKKRYFGGGTVDMVVSLKEQWHVLKTTHLHEQLEDGTLPLHSIIATKSALSVHADLYGSLQRISKHTSFLAQRLYTSLQSLRHGNSEAVCQIYKEPTSTYGDTKTQGPVVAFNLRDGKGQWVSNLEVEKLAHIRNINIRTGGLCNPGGIQSALNLSPWQMKDNFSSGQRCGSESDDVINGHPTGMIRASLGAMSTIKDVDTFVSFISEFFLDRTPALDNPTLSPTTKPEPQQSNQLYIESLTVYPIKSCAGWQVPANTPWEVRPEGLAWDREWCITHIGTSAALSQKKYPRMALLRPSFDFLNGVLRITCAEPLKGSSCSSSSSSSYPAKGMCVPLSADPRCFAATSTTCTPTNVCGDNVAARIYASPVISSFLSAVLGVPCQLARFPTSSASGTTLRHAKPHLRGVNVDDVASCPSNPLPLHFSNESPILAITRMSLDSLNASIAKAHVLNTTDPPQPTPASSFRANIIISQQHSSSSAPIPPYAEDDWKTIYINQNNYTVLGPCRRCHMVCIDQSTAEKRQEPFVTLAKTRKGQGGRVFFGVHLCLCGGKTGREKKKGVGGGDDDGGGGSGRSYLKIGDVVGV